MIQVLTVALGGSLGAVTRYLVSQWAARKLGAGFPYGTLLVNTIGCFIIGFFMTLAVEKYVISPYWRLLVTVGFLGGLTTFSSFSYETFKLLESGTGVVALLNVASNLFLGFTLTWLGVICGRAISS